MEQQNDNRADRLCKIALICLVVPVIYTLVLGEMLIFISLIGGGLVLLIDIGMLAAYIVGLITIINVRIQYPEHEFSKKVMGIYIIGTVIILGMIWKSATMCYDCITCKGF